MNTYFFKQLQSNFQKELNESTKKQNLIENEIREIEHFLVPKVYHQPTNVLAGGSGTPPERESYHVFRVSIPKGYHQLFSRAFKQFDIKGKFDFEPFPNTPESTIQNSMLVIQQAEEFSKYYSWLKDLINGSEKTGFRSKLSHAQKLLALHYLGLDLRNYDYSKSARILTEVYGQNSADIRKLIPHLTGSNNKVMNEKNIKGVLNLFRSIGFTGITEQIELDLEKNTKKS
ncbi:hypothetical protein [Flagellimonas marinaquae]|uniref:hypothetical protein n=1 Tax=Flagellimonas marinaquae TaxID=254955 RepID=UPI002075057A|nr:hypothetical protein [Allomuricauda aquimarina]USD26597.1 hypothetical protein MJO53_06775 [Allomuricauda aquimarina]